MKHIVNGFPTKECPLLNYLVILGKYICGNAEGEKNFQIFKGFGRKLKYETEKYICTKHKKMEYYFNKKWKINFIKLLLVHKALLTGACVYECVCVCVCL